MPDWVRLLQSLREPGVSVDLAYGLQAITSRLAVVAAVLFVAWTLFSGSLAFLMPLDYRLRGDDCLVLLEANPRATKSVWFATGAVMAAAMHVQPARPQQCPAGITVRVPNGLAGGLAVPGHWPGVDDLVGDGS